MKISASSEIKQLYLSLTLILLITISTLSHADNFRSFTFDSFSEIKSTFQGQEFLLGLWSVDCPPCLVELSMMGNLLELNPVLTLCRIITVGTLLDCESR